MEDTRLELSAHDILFIDLILMTCIGDDDGIL